MREIGIDGKSCEICGKKRAGLGEGRPDGVTVLVTWRVGGSGLVDGLIDIVGQQEVHHADDFMAAGVIAVRDTRPDGCRYGPRAMHGLDAVLFEHHFREVPGLPIVFHVPLRPRPLLVVQ